MSHKTALKRLERLAGRRWARDDFAQQERARLDAMTDEQLERHITALAEMLRTLDEAGALEDVLDAELVELLRQDETV